MKYVCIFLIEQYKKYISPLQSPLLSVYAELLAVCNRGLFQMGIFDWLLFEPFSCRKV